MKHAQMMRITVAVLGIGLAFVVARTLAADDPKPFNEVEHLRDRVAKLTQENLDLAAKLDAATRENAELKRQLAQPNPVRIIPSPRPAPGAPRTLPQLPPGQAVPKDWVEREFNGQKYYLIPVEEQRSSPVMPIVPK